MIYEVSFTEDRAEIIRADGDLVTTLEVQVSPEDDAEVRRLSISNSSTRAREIEVTSYAELVLGAQAADVAHPVFSKLFVRTEFLPRENVLLANRRRRAPDEPEVWASHHAVIEGTAVAGPEFETDRMAFIGRGRELRAPLALLEGRALTGSSGTVLDAVFALRYRLRVPAGGTARVAFWTCVAPAVPRCSNSRTSIVTRTRTCASRRSPGRRPRCSCAISASTPRRRISFSSSPAESSMPTPPHARRVMPFAAARAARSRCGRRVFRGICPS